MGPRVRAQQRPCHYDSRKLTVKGILKRMDKSYTYTLEEKGIKTCTIFVKVRTSLLEPCMSHPKTLYSTSLKIEKAYRRLDWSFEALMDVIGLKRAA